MMRTITANADALAEALLNKTEAEQIPIIKEYEARGWQLEQDAEEMAANLEESMTEAIAEASKTAEDNVDAVEEKIRIALEEQA